MKLTCLRKLVFLAILLGVCCSDGRHSAGHPQGMQSRGEEARRRFEAKRDEIIKERGELPAEHWAGVYYHGFGYDYNHIFVAPKSGAIYWYSTDVIGDETFYFGSLTESDGKITISWEDKDDGPSWLSELLIVKWGKRHYLVPPFDAPAFGAAVRSGKEPEMSRPLWGFIRLVAREIDEAPGGELQVPDRFKKCFEPIITTIAAIGEESSSGSHALLKQITIAAGEADGVILQMRFQVPEHGFQPLYRVKVVREHESDAEVIEYSDIDPVIPMTVGMRISTVMEFQRNPWAPEK